MNRILYLTIYFLSTLALSSAVIIGGNSPAEDPVGPSLPIVQYPHQIPTTGKLLNISSRGSVGGNDEQLIVGFVVSAGNRAVLIRSVGEGLSKFGVEVHIVNPSVEIRNAKGEILVTGIPIREVGDTGYQILSETSNRIGAFPLDRRSSDVAILMLLEPGAYTCLVRGNTGASGEVLVEVYDIPPDLTVPGL